MSTYILCAFDFEKDLKIYIIQLENSLQYTALCLPYSLVKYAHIDFFVELNMSDNALIKVRNVSFSYQSKQIYKNLTLDIPKGKLPQF